MDEKINLIMDDIRTLKVLGQYLSGKRADVVTFAFCGVPGTYWFEGDYALDSHDLTGTGDEAIRRNDAVLNTLRGAAFHQSAKLLKPGGKLIYVDRMKVDAEETPIQKYERVFGKLPVIHLETVRQRILQPNLDENLGMRVEATGAIPKTIDVVLSKFEYKP